MSSTLLSAVADSTQDMPSWMTYTLAALAAIGGLGGMTGLGAFLMLKKSGRKMDADTASILTTAATTLVKPLEQRVNAQEVEILALRDEVHGMRSALTHRDQLAAEHAGWDYLAEEKMKEAGLTYPSRPPLLPPSPSGSDLLQAAAAADRAS